MTRVGSQRHRKKNVNRIFAGKCVDFVISILVGMCVRYVFNTPAGTGVEYFYLHSPQGSQCTYNITLRRVLATIVAVEFDKYYIF